MSAHRRHARAVIFCLYLLQHPSAANSFPNTSAAPGLTSRALNVKFTRRLKDRSVQDIFLKIDSRDDMIILRSQITELDRV